MVINFSIFLLLSRSHHLLHLYIIRLGNSLRINLPQLFSSLRTARTFLTRLLTLLLWLLGRCSLHGSLVVPCLLNCHLLGLLPILPVRLHFQQFLQRDSHIISLGQVSQLNEFTFLRLSFIFIRLDQWLVAEGTFDAVYGRMGRCWQILATSIHSQFGHCALKFGVYPLPDAYAME